MNTKLLMTVSALVMGAVGISFTFLPKEILSAMRMEDAHPIFLQILGALYSGFAMIN